MDRASWIHNQSGVDYGPYDSQTVIEMIISGDISREDGLMDQFTGRQCKPAEVPGFEAALLEFEEQQREAQIAREAEESYSDLKQRRLLPVFIVLMLILPVVMSWDKIKAKLDPSSRHSALAAVTMPITPSPTVAIQALPSFKAKQPEDVSSSKTDTKTIKVRARPKTEARKKKKARTPTPAPQAEPQVQEFDFAAEDEDYEDDETNLPSPLGASEIRQFMSEKLKPAIMRCVRVQREELVLPAYRVHLRLKPSGNLSLHSITPAEAKVEGLRSCIQLQVKRNQYRVFTGAERKLELPIKVQ